MNEYDIGIKRKSFTPLHKILKSCKIIKMRLLNNACWQKQKKYQKIKNNNYDDSSVKFLLILNLR